MTSLEKFYTHSGTIRNNQIYEESTTGSNKNLRYFNTNVTMKDVDFNYGACLPIYSLPQSHPNLASGKHGSTTTFYVRYANIL